MNAEEHNTKENINKIFSNPNYVKNYLDPSRLKFYEGVKNTAITRGLNLEDKRIADMGCGTGHFLNCIDQDHDVESFTGFDFSEKALEIATQLSWRNEIDFYNHDLHNSLESFISAFDVVFCIQTLEHLIFPEKAFINMISTLAPGGAIVITIPDGTIDGLVGTLHINSWNMDQLVQFIKDTGMSILASSHYEVGYLGTDLWAIVWNKSNA